MEHYGFPGLVDEVAKIASSGRGVGQLLSSLAQRSGVRPSMVPGIKQVQNIADSGNRSRAAEVARNVRGYLKKNPGPSASTMPRSSPKLPAAGISGG